MGGALIPSRTEEMVEEKWGHPRPKPKKEFRNHFRWTVRRVLDMFYKKLSAQQQTRSREGVQAVGLLYNTTILPQCEDEMHTDM